MLDGKYNRLNFDLSSKLATDCDESLTETNKKRSFKISKNKEYLDQFMKILLKLSFLASLFLCGCSLFIGNIKPAEEKAQDYGANDLSQTNPDWIKLEKLTSMRNSDGLPKTESYDAAYQSKKTSSIISINSACKTVGNYKEETTLLKLSQQLLLGMSDIVFRNEEEKSIDGFPALQTTVQGNLGTERMMIRTLVFIRNNCVFDLMYIARPEKFQENEKDFSSFISSLRLR